MFPILDPAEVERRLEALIVKHKAKNISVAEIKRRIFEAGSDDVMRDSNLFHKWWMQIFSRVSNEDEEFTNLIEAFQDAWNSFPHGSLSGKSPQQMVEEQRKKHPEMFNKSKSHGMPKVIVGGMTMSMDAHRKMIERMTKEQMPFKRWIENDVLPQYKEFLESKFKTKKAVDKHYQVADMFFIRVLHVGFLDFEQIRPAFAVWEFPDWWPSHIMHSNLTEDQVWSSLCDFLIFINIELHRKIPGIWQEAGMERSSLDDLVDVQSFAPSLTLKVGRNDPCPCGALKQDCTPLKYKHCHGKNG